MTSDARRISLLAKLQRVRSIERKQALLHLSDAEQNRNRMADLAQRSEALLHDYGRRSQTELGGDLRNLLHVRAHLRQTNHSVRELGAEANLTAEQAGEVFAAADKRLELTSQRLNEASIERAQLREATDNVLAKGSSAKLARGLQSSNRDPSRK